MGKVFENGMAEKEANEIAFKFMNSNDVVKDMSEAYNVDFSGINFHSDASADSKVKSEGKDAIASGNDIFIGKGILESNDAASKGLVAHELVHTMQQGVVESSGVVNESVSEGAEQGGIRDWFRKLFGKKNLEISEPENVKQDFSPEAMEYNNAIRGIRMEEDEERRKGTLSDKMLEDFSSHNKEYIAESDKTYNSGLERAEAEGKPVNRRLLQNDAFVKLGHRALDKATGKDVNNISRIISAGSAKQYRNYMNTMDAVKTNYGDLMKDYKLYDNQDLAQKQYGYNEAVNFVSGDMLDIMGKAILSEDGVKFAHRFSEDIKDAEVFKTGNETVSNYILQTILNYQNIDMKNSMKFMLGGKDKNRDQFVNFVSKGIMSLPIINNMSDEEKSKLPAETKELYAKYQELERQLVEQMGRYGKSKAGV